MRGRGRQRQRKEGIIGRKESKGTREGDEKCARGKPVQWEMEAK